MLTIISLAFLALTFFFILSHGADLLLGNLKALADRSKIHPVLLGLILGFLTTVPEFMVGLNAIRQDVATLSLGNIWGGVIVILALILGLSIILQKKIKTDGHLFVILPSFLFILFSLFLGTKGSLNYYDGFFLLIFYLIIVYLDFLSGGHYRSDNLTQKAVLEAEGIKKEKLWFGRRLYDWQRKYNQESVWAFLGLLLVVISSYAIMEIADIFLAIFPLPPFLVGLLIFAIGTNLPEITVMFRSVKLKSGDISFGHLVGSAVSNILVLGLLTFVSPIYINVSWRYYVLMIFSFLILAAVSWFYVSKKSFDRREGFALLFLYICFVFYELFL